MIIQTTSLIEYEPHLNSQIFFTNNLLFFSSFIFLTNVVANYVKTYYVYSALFVFLIVTSLIFHSNNNIYTNILDKIAIFCIFIYGSYVLYNNLNMDKLYQIILIILTFISCIFLFFYGFCCNQYCYNSDKVISDYYHCMLHFIGSFGHHLITFL